MKKYNLMKEMEELPKMNLIIIINKLLKINKK